MMLLLRVDSGLTSVDDDEEGDGPAQSPVCQHHCHHCHYHSTASHMRHIISGYDNSVVACLTVVCEGTSSISGSNYG
jgi:hypothetical protein